MTLRPDEIRAADLSGPEAFRQDLVAACRPVVIRGLVAAWPAVAAGRGSADGQSFRDYVAGFDAGERLEAFFGAPSLGGKYYYGAGADGFNFERRTMRLLSAIDAVIGLARAPENGTAYVGSAPLTDYLPGFLAANPMPLLRPEIGGRIWIGNASNVSCHYDAQDNLACVVAGRRRFTLYAPELISRLYVGAIDHTMAGQPVSLAASSPPDPARFPKFEGVQSLALVAELEPGDALYLPKLWWHQVEGLSGFNVLVNFWWDAFAAGPDSPYTALLLSMITLAERPGPERAAWRAFFEHYVFRPDGHPLAHLPPEQHGLLGPLAATYGKLRARVMHLLRGG